MATLVEIAMLVVGLAVVLLSFWSVVRAVEKQPAIRTEFSEDLFVAFQQPFLDAKIGILLGSVVAVAGMSLLIAEALTR